MELTAVLLLRVLGGQKDPIQRNCKKVVVKSVQEKKKSVQETRDPIKSASRHSAACFQGFSAPGIFLCPGWASCWLPWTQPDPICLSLWSEDLLHFLAWLRWFYLAFNHFSAIATSFPTFLHPETHPCFLNMCIHAFFLIYPFIKMQGLSTICWALC